MVGKDNWAIKNLNLLQPSWLHYIIAFLLCVQLYGIFHTNHEVRNDNSEQDSCRRFGKKDQILFIIQSKIIKKLFTKRKEINLSIMFK